MAGAFYCNIWVMWVSWFVDLNSRKMYAAPDSTMAILEKNEKLKELHKERMKKLTCDKTRSSGDLVRQVIKPHLACAALYPAKPCFPLVLWPAPQCRLLLLRTDSNSHSLFFSWMGWRGKWGIWRPTTLCTKRITYMKWVDVSSRRWRLDKSRDCRCWILGDLH